MTNRTVKVLGWGTGTANITAILDGETVFSGSVNLEPFSFENETEQTAPTLFTFEIPLDFVGTKHMEISVEDAEIRFGQIVANYSEVDMGGIVYSNGPDVYADVSDRDTRIIVDPRTNVTIDGEPQMADRSLGKGTWHWTVPPGSKFKHDITVDLPGMLE